jgi:tetratricopeptide (TPR) repeat protein
MTCGRVGLAPGGFPRRKRAAPGRIGRVFWKKKRFDRAEELAAADRARARGRRKQAIAGYRRILAADPNDLAVRGKIAPLLARAGKRTEALASFRAAADGHLRAGFTDRAVALFRQAAELFPDEESLWSDTAKLHLQRGRRGDAVAVLVAAGRTLSGTRHRAVGAKLLRRALDLEPWQPDATLLLARVLARDRRRSEALALLDQLSSRVRGRLRRVARGLAFRISPTPANLWRWARAVLG